MKRRLFLTGPMGCGKSTAILRALGDNIGRCGGFLTRRIRDERGRALSFSLACPDGSREETFLDFSTGRPEIHMDVFGSLGVRLLTGDILVLDEIGGIELLDAGFAGALESVLQSDTPILGVLKGEGPAGALINAVGLPETYSAAADRLRRILQEDEDTLLYECGQFDEHALHLAVQWAEEYLYE